MLDEYSIEQRATQIFDERSKEYFSEVLSCYSAGNHRSAVVMLWSVVVCDLLFKLQHLVDLYGDAKAKSILTEIGQMQQDNERSPVWETKLVESVAEQTQLLDIAERENLLHLQKQRHLAAHPVINASFQLHQPNRDTTRALIRNALDGLLAKAPILSKQIVSDLIIDLEQASGILIDDRKLKAYLESKYYTRFNPVIEKYVFKALWKFVFKVTDEKCSRNRDINYKALRWLFDRNPIQFQTQIESERDYFSSIASEGAPVIYLIHFLSCGGQTYPCLADHAKVIIQQTTENDTTAYCLAWFLADSLNQHETKIADKIANSDRPRIDQWTWDAIKELSDSPEWEKAIVRLANKYYIASWSFSMADERFSEVIRTALEFYTLEDCKELIEGIEQNDQTYLRNKAGSDHKLVYERIRQLDPTFNFDGYPNFTRCIK